MYLRVNQEPQTKSISDDDARYFRKVIRKQIRKANRRAFKGDVVMEISFSSTAVAPQPVQTLVKNYLDLLHKPMPGTDKYEKLAFNDDSQIKLLIANHYPGSDEARIFIKLYRFSYFIKDAEYAQNIIRNEFSDKSYSLRDGLVLEERNPFSLEPSLGELIRDFEKHKKDGPRPYTMIPELQEDIIRKQIFSAYIKQNNLRLESLFEYLKILFRHNRDYRDDEQYKHVFRITRDYMFIGLDFIPMGGAPIREGESKIFRKHLQAQLKQFVKEHDYLFPLLSPVGLTIACIPPAYRAPDADNLARQIVSFFDEICRPPLSHTSLPGVPTYRTGKVRISTSSYQIIYLPRNEADPENGKIMVLMNTGYMNLNGLWGKVDNLIEKWEDHIKFRHY